MSLLGVLLRWLLAPVSVVAVVIAVIAAGRGSVSLIDQRCPDTSMVGGACVAPWHTSAVEAVIYAGAVLVALGLVIVPALIAPALKRTVAVFALVLMAGALGNIYYRTGWGELGAPLLVTVATGALALWWVCTRTSAHAAQRP